MPLDPPAPPRLAALVDALVAACEADERIRAAWLGGSLARGTADDWSDVDLHLALEEPESFDAATWLGAVAPLVLADPIPGVPHSLVAVTPDWLHVDVVAHTAGLEQDDAMPARVVLDRDGVLGDRRGAPIETGEPTYPAADVRLFLYFMGGAVAAFRRRELVALLHGVSGMRDALLVPLMLAENGIRKNDGARRLDRYLTSEQHAALLALPLVGPDEDRLLRGLEAVAGQYLGRARRLAERCGAEWPADLEAATLRLWSDELGIGLGAGPSAADAP